jgi:hypothetical protein
MAIHKLLIEDFDQIDYDLIAIHTSLEDYQLAFKLNQKLYLSFNRNSNEISIDVQNIETFFSRYTFEDEEQMVVWDLIQNKQEIQLPIKTKAKNLFENNNINITTRVSLVSELKKIDYFLKIEHDSHYKINALIHNIKTIDSISMVYEVNPNKIKSKNNLIF